MSTKDQEVQKKYSIEMFFNGLEFKAESDSLEDAVLSLKPEQLHTEVFINATDGKTTSERRWKLIDAKRVFSDKDVRHIFVNNLLLT